MANSALTQPIHWPNHQFSRSALDLYPYWPINYLTNSSHTQLSIWPNCWLTDKLLIELNIWPTSSWPTVESASLAWLRLQPYFVVFCFLSFFTFATLSLPYFWSKPVRPTDIGPTYIWPLICTIKVLRLIGTLQFVACLNKVNVNSFTILASVVTIINKDCTVFTIINHVRKTMNFYFKKFYGTRHGISIRQRIRI